MTTEKTPNYTDAQAAELKAAYVAVDQTDTEAGQKARDAVVDTFAADLGKSRRSVISKLSTMGVYKKKVHTNKATGAKTVKKDALVEQIANVMQVTSEQLGGLEKANKGTLARILGTIAALRERVEAENA